MGFAKQRDAKMSNTPKSKLLTIEWMMLAMLVFIIGATVVKYIDVWTLQAAFEINTQIVTERK